MGGWSREHTCPADVLVPNWVLGKPAAFDLSVTSALNAQIFQEACVTAGSAALAAQIRKHTVNDRELGWVCTSLLWWRHTDVGVLRLFKHYRDLPPVRPLGRDVPSHLCAMKSLEGLVWPL